MSHAPATRGAARIVVVPCFNEAKRIDVAGLLQLITPNTAVLFVDDGSTDATEAVLQTVCASHPAARLLSLHDNVGKAEAVRAGLNAAIGNGATIVGYFDADLATAPADMLRILDTLEQASELRAVLGSRVRLLGRGIERRALRHYLGRVFATSAALTLGFSVYDTQCGAKAFRVDATLIAALSAPFASRWAFDVELLARITQRSGSAGLFELPLTQWRDVGGGSLGPRAMLQAGIDLAALNVRGLSRSKRTQR